MPSAAYPASPRADFAGALVFIAFGCAVAALSWQMDRMEQQGASLHTAPGLWPGILGLLIAAMGGLLALRSLRRARHARWDAAEADDTPLVPRTSFALAVGLFFVYALLLVGRGLPFWLGTALFVSLFVFLFQRSARKAQGTTVRGVAVALLCGIATAVSVTLVFEQLFFVRLP